jgi:hypothetical protein
VVADMSEHTPGSFVVVLAPLREMLTASRRKKDPEPNPPPAPALGDLERKTIDALRVLATYALDGLGVVRNDAMVSDEMVRQFSRLAQSVPEGPDRERRLRDAMAAALQELDDL